MPVNVKAPAVGGNIVAGGRLSGHPGTWKGLPANAYRYEWQRCESAAAASCTTFSESAAYEANADDLGRWFRVVATVLNAEGEAREPARAIGPVAVPSFAGSVGIRNLAPPVISGRGQVGEMLDASEGLWYAPPGTTFRYEWSRCSSSCTAIAGATAPYYVVRPDDLTQDLRVAVTPVPPTTSTATPTTATSSLVPTGPCLDEFCQPNPCEPPLWKPGLATVQLSAPAVIRPDGTNLVWSGSAGQYFRSFEVHRSMSINFEPNASTLLATFSDPAATSYNDTTAISEDRYFYKIVLVTSCENVISNEQDVTMPRLGRTTLVFQPGAGMQATTIFAQSDDSTAACRNTGADPKLRVGTTTNAVYRTLLNFNLVRVPTNAIVDSANLVLEVAAGPTTELSLVADKVTRSWEEGTGTFATSGCSSSGATWQRASSSAAWSSLGADTDNGEWAAGAVGGVDDLRPDVSELSLTALVNGWVQSGSQNVGLLLRSSEEAPGTGRMVELFSDDGPTVRGPRLEVTYEAPSTDEDGNTRDVGELAERLGGPYSENEANRINVPLTASEDPNATPLVRAPVLPPDVKPSATTFKVGIRRSSYANRNITFFNDDGEWTIFLDCLGPPGRSVTVGPGYVAVFRDTQIVNANVTPVQTANILMVDGRQNERTGQNNDGDRTHIQEAGGLGLFGWHHARGEVGKTSADATGVSGQAYKARSTRQFFAIEGQRCADATYTHPVGDSDPSYQHTGHGVQTQRLLPTHGSNCLAPDQSAENEGAGNWRDPAACKFFNKDGVGFLDMEVIYKDRWQPAMKVTYRWRIRPEGVKLWMVAQPLATVLTLQDPYCAPPKVTSVCSDADPTMEEAQPFIKEPKFVAAFRGSPPGYTRMYLFTQGRKKGNAAGAGAGSMRGGSGVVFTRVFNIEGMSRVRWDYAGVNPPVSQDDAARQVQDGLRLRNANPKKYGNCPLPTDPPAKKLKPCFSVVARAFDPDKILPESNPDLGYTFTGETYPWQKGLVKPINCATNPNLGFGVDGAGFGFEQWACDVDRAAHPKALTGDDTTSPDPNNPGKFLNPPCRGYTLPPTSHRGWELAGNKSVAHLLSNPNALNARGEIKEVYGDNNIKPFAGASASLFTGWRGGRGYTDCEMLLRQFVTGRRPGGRLYRYGVYATFGLNGTYSLAAQDGDNQKELAP